METYRYLSPMVNNLLPRIRTANNTAGLNVKVSEQILLDFDGASLQTSEHPAGALYDIQALLQPNTDGYYILKQYKRLKNSFAIQRKLTNPIDCFYWSILHGETDRALEYSVLKRRRS